MPDITPTALQQYRQRFPSRTDGLDDHALRKRIASELRRARPLKLSRQALAAARMRTGKPGLQYVSEADPFLDRAAAEPVFCVVGTANSIATGDADCITVFAPTLLREQLGLWLLAPVTIEPHAINRWCERIGPGDAWDLAHHWESAEPLGPSMGDPDSIGYGVREPREDGSPVLVYLPSERRILTTMTWAQFRSTATTGPRIGAKAPLDLSAVPVPPSVAAPASAAARNGKAPAPAADIEASGSSADLLGQLQALMRSAAAAEAAQARVAELEAAGVEALKAIDAVVAGLRPALSAAEAIAAGLRKALGR